MEDVKIIEHIIVKEEINTTGTETERESFTEDKDYTTIKEEPVLGGVEDNKTGELRDFRRDDDLAHPTFEFLPHLSSQKETTSMIMQYSKQHNQDYRRKFAALDTSSNANCAHCEFVSSSKNNLIHHLFTKHFSTNDYDECSYSTSNLHHLTLDKKLKPFQCHKCGYSSTQKCQLKIHESAVHMKLKPFQCNKCNYSAARKGQLKAHETAVHMELKPFQCLKCNFCAAQQNKLRTHERAVHMEIKPFQCHKCDYSAARKINLKRHETAVHMKLKPFQCLKCDYSAAQQHHLKAHETAEHMNISSSISTTH